MAKKHNGMGWQTILVVVLVGALLVSILGLSIFSNIGSVTKKQVSTRELALSCTTDMATQFHIHPHLDIYINGEKQAIPANTGIESNGCMHPLHTHDATGTVHVESPEQRDFALSDFFAVWGQPFSQNQILSAKTDATHEIVMTVDGKPSTEYENVILKDLENIVIRYQVKGTKAATSTVISNIEVQTTGGGTVKINP